MRLMDENRPNFCRWRASGGERGNWKEKKNTI